MDISLCGFMAVERGVRHDKLTNVSGKVARVYEKLVILSCLTPFPPEELREDADFIDENEIIEG